MGRILEQLGGKVDESIDHNRKIRIPQNTDIRDMFPQGSIPNEAIEALDIAKLRTGVLQSQRIDLSVLEGAGDVGIFGGTYDRALWTATGGFLMGIDDSDSNKVKLFLGNATNWMDWNVTTLNTLTIAGSLVASQIHIPDENTTANSFHVETDGDAWWGTTHTNWTADNNNATAYILKTGVARFASITLTGNVAISGIANNTLTDIQLLDFSHNLVFSVTDADTVAWTAGTITISNGRTFTIDAGNTGNMSALTYIYLDPAISSTVLQLTTTFSTATGANKKVVAVAQNQATGNASVISYGGGQPIINGATQISALSIIAGAIAAGTITVDKLSVATLSAITANIGTITSGSITSSTLINTTTLQIGGVSITATAVELNIMDGVTSSTAELNILDGVTSDAAELNKLDGTSANVTATNLNTLTGGGDASALHTHTSLAGEGMAKVGILGDAGAFGPGVLTVRPGMLGGNIYYGYTNTGVVWREDLGGYHGIPVSNTSRTWTSDVTNFSSGASIQGTFSDGTYVYFIFTYTNTTPATVRGIIRYAAGLTGGTVMTISGGTQNQDAASWFWDNTAKALYIAWNSGSILLYDKYTTSGSPISTFTFSSNYGTFGAGNNLPCDGTFVWRQNAGLEKWTLATAALTTTYAQPNLQVSFNNFSDGGTHFWVYDNDNLKGLKKTAVGG